MTDQVKEITREEEQEARDERPLSTADVARSMGEPRQTEPEQESKETPLMSDERAAEFRSRWDKIQTSFVDEPRNAVEHADSLVAEVMQFLAKTFADERQNLEGQWGQGKDVSTEDLRLALQRYRSFFSRLLSV